MTAGGADWDPGAYAEFRADRLRPALDLMMQIKTPPSGGVFDLGCGDGAIAAALRSRFPKRQVVGVDASPAMLERANGYHRKVLADIAQWCPDGPAAVIFSNAALHWLGDHAALLPRLAGLLEPGRCACGADATAVWRAVAPVSARHRGNHVSRPL